MNFRTLLPSAFVVLAATGSALASPITFNFAIGGTPATVNNSNLGNVYTFTSGGVTATVTSYSFSNATSAFQDAATDRWSPGLGVCSSAEIANCGSPQHQVDNSGATEMVFIQFSKPVDLSSITIQSFGGTYDTDATYYTRGATTTLDLTGTTLAGLSALGFSGATNSDAGISSNARTITFNSSGQVTSILFGARSGAGADATADYFKLESLSVNCNPTATPEPATYGLVGAALLGAGLFRRKKA